MTKPVLEHALSTARGYLWLQQFGQTGDASTLNGALGCTHTILQYLLLLWKGRRLSHDQISLLAGYPFPDDNPTRRGMTNMEVGVFCAEVDLPYEWAFDLTPSQILQKSNIAPVLLGVKYKDWPAAKSMGVPPRNGFRNGNASRFGADQSAGFDGGHAVALIGYETMYGAPLIYAKEPNHGSQARPKRPDYDTMTSSQFSNAAKSWKKLYPAGNTYALVPTGKAGKMPL